MIDYKSTEESIKELRKLAENAPPNIQGEWLREVEHLETLMNMRRAEIQRMNKTRNIKTLERLQEIMELKRLTVADVAEGTGIPEPVIYAYTAGNYTPKIDQIKILAKYLNVSEFWLLGYDELTEKKIFVIYCDSPDDICFMLGYIEGTEEDAEKYCKEHNATITCPLNMVEWEKLDKLNP